MSDEWVVDLIAIAFSIVAIGLGGAAVFVLMNVLIYG